MKTFLPYKQPFSQPAYRNPSSLVRQARPEFNVTYFIKLPFSPNIRTIISKNYKKLYLLSILR